MRARVSVRDLWTDLAPPETKGGVSLVHSHTCTRLPVQQVFVITCPILLLFYKL